MPVIAKGSFYASKNNDRESYYYNYNEYLKVLSSNGVATRGESLSTQLQCTPGAGMVTNVAKGEYVSQGVLTVIEAGTLTHSAANITNPRIDRIIVEVNHDAGVRASSVKILEGEPNASPEPPALTQNSTVWQESIRKVYIPANETSASNFTYTDERVAATMLVYVPDGSITNAKMSTDVKIGSLASLNTSDKSSVQAAINEVCATANTAQSTANTAQSKANTAQSKANTALDRLPFCELSRTTEQTSFNVVAWTNDILDDFNMHPANESAINIPLGQAGEYSITGSFALRSTTTTSFTQPFYITNNTNQIYCGLAIFNTGLAIAQFAFIHKFAAGDQIRIQFAANFSDSLKVDGSLTSRISVKRIR